MTQNDPFLIPPTFQNGEVNLPGNSQKRVKKVGTKGVKNDPKWVKNENFLGSKIASFLGAIFDHFLKPYFSKPPPKRA